MADSDAPRCSLPAPWWEGESWLSAGFSSPPRTLRTLLKISAGVSLGKEARRRGWQEGEEGFYAGGVEGRRAARRAEVFPIMLGLKCFPASALAS